MEARESKVNEYITKKNQENIKLKILETKKDNNHKELTE